MIRPILLLIAATLSALTLSAQDSKPHAVTVTGRVIDTGCYMVHDGSGPEHEKCARVCAKKGIPLAIVDDTGKVWMPLGADHRNPNTQLMPFIEKNVKVTATEFNRGGLTGIAIKTIELAK